MDFNISLEKEKSFSVTRDDLLILQPEREHISVKSALEEQTIFPTGEMVIGSVKVEPVKYQSKEVTPADNTQIITADEGYDALSEVSVFGVGGGYKRPSWYPDALGILHNASQVEKDGIIFYPVAILVVDGMFKDNIKLNYSKPSYYENDAIGGDAYIFSDNTNELVLGLSNPTHTWDKSKDFVNPSNELERVRWVLVFSKNTITLEDGSIIPRWITSTSNFVLVTNTDVVEFWADNVVLGTSSLTSTTGNFAFGANTNTKNYTLRYIYIGENTRAYFARQTFAYMLVLEQLDIFSQYCVFASNTFYGNAMGLKSITITTKNYSGTFLNFSNLGYIKNVENFNFSMIVNDSDTTQGYGSMPLLKINDFSNFVHNESVTGSDAYVVTIYQFSASVKEIILPDNVATGVNFKNAPSTIAEYMKIPNNIKTITGASVLRYIKNVELYDNFDISGVWFTDSGFWVKDFNWLMKFCGWLKDKSNDAEAGTARIGTEQIERLERMFLTYDPVSKEILSWANNNENGEISAFEFLTIQKNWTLS